MKINEEQLQFYTTPQILIYDIINEGILCSSNETLEIIESEWS